MSAGETPSGRGGSVLAGLLAPLRLPERVLEALDSDEKRGPLEAARDVLTGGGGD